MRYVIGLFIAALLLARCGEPPQPSQQDLDRAFATVNAGLAHPTGTAGRIVTIDGRDETGALIDPVNVWRDYTNRSAGIATRVHDGDKVTMVRRVGQGVQIRTSAGAEGWVTYSFIRELH